MIDPKSYYEFSPGLCRALMDPFSGHKELCFDYIKILEREMGVEFVKGWASDVEPGNCTVKDWSGQPIRDINFDYCVICTGVENGIWKVF